ncbi:MAG: class I SAM-dependent methyltransferase [Anaerolineae bacterium]
MRGERMTPSAFDAFAPAYDAGFTHTRLGRWLRERVWRVLADVSQPGQRVLELACGTGEDALWLARRGLSVVATDGSGLMLRVARGKTTCGGGAGNVAPVRLPLQQIIAGAAPFAGPQFDGVLSNFGGLNTIGDWRGLARGLSLLVRPGGWLVLVPMGPCCPWETGWHLAHGDAATALRRWRQPATANIGGQLIPVWYPSARHLRRDFAPWFTHRRTESLGLWLPPSYLGRLVERRPGLFARLYRLEQATARLTVGCGDHYISVFNRK